ncbi:hypothetical protein LIER_40208 [Lithospermum erythrorhizon]|uniref:Uncharacterized protein n=1 Tax=Lithospermum erythrorhizon TaxID=34254 RepID=A0AAV3QTF8_LITER
MEITLEGIRITEGLEELVQNSDAGRDSLFKSSSQTLEKTIRVMQAKMEEGELEVPSSLWDAVRDDVSSSDPLSL